MTLTLFGVLTILISLWLMLRGTALQQFSFVILTSLLGGSSAIDLPALGGSSIRPFLLAFLLLFARIILTQIGEISAILRALKKNVALVCFCVYGVVSAFLLPHVFAGQIDLVPMRPSNVRHDLTLQLPLAFSSQNITAAFYLGGTLLGLVVGDILGRRQGAYRTVVNTVVLTSWLHIGFGVLSVVLKLAHHEELLSVFRNANYAQLDHEYRGYIRIAGIMPEASTYASYAFQLMVITTELWLRGVNRKWTGPTSFALAVILVLSSSSSAYVGVAGYAAVLLLRWIVFPQGLGTRNAAILLASGVGAAASVMVLAALFRDTAAQLQDMLHHMTLDKANSQSAYERGIWARQGIDAFFASGGLGVGAGSFRSSSNILAILGSLGVFGIVTFLVYAVQVLQPWRDSTFRRSRSDVQAVGVALSWTVLIDLITGLVNAPSPDPGVLFALYASMSLALRQVREPQPASVAPASSPGSITGPAREIA